MVILGLSVIAYLLEVWPRFDSRWIPVVCIILGAASYPLFANVKSVPAEFPYPFAVLIVNGLVSGLIAFIVHKTLVARLIQRFQSAPQNQTETPK